MVEQCLHLHQRLEECEDEGGDPSKGGIASVRGRGIGVLSDLCGFLGPLTVTRSLLATNRMQPQALGIRPVFYQSVLWCFRMWSVVVVRNSYDTLVLFMERCPGHE